MKFFKSPWHFDKSRKDEDGEYVKCLGRFIGNFEEEIALARSRPLVAQRYNEQNYNHAANKPSLGHIEEDKANPEGKPSSVMFNKINFDKTPDDYPTFMKVLNFLHLDTNDKLTCKMNDQYPNDQLMWHVDNLPGNPVKDRVIDNPDFIYNPDKIRFLVMIEDWEPGQILQFGNKVYTQWQAGMVLSWEWSTLPHMTFNGSWKKRAALQITGTATEKTWDFVRAGHHHHKYII